MLLLASALLGFVPVVVPWLSVYSGRNTPEDLRVAVAIILVLLFGSVSLLILGSTMVGRDLSEGRLGFFFSRPVSGWALWLSRITAAGVLWLLSVLLMIAPAAAVSFDSWADKLTGTSAAGHALPLLGLKQLWSPGFDLQTLPALPPVAVRVLIWLGVTVLLLTAIHIVSSILRARSAWLLVDLAALAVVATLGWSAREVLVREQALGALVWAEWLLLPWLLGAVVLAGGMQLTRGRTDIARGHRFLSLTLWPAVLAAVLAFGAYARWVAAGEVEDLTELTYVEPSPNEDWLLVGGPVRGRAGTAAAFLLEVGSGRSWRLGNLGIVRLWADFSADGGTVAWARCRSYMPLDCEVWTKDLRRPDSPPRPTGVPLGDTPYRLALSGDGSRVALVETERIVIYQLSSARLLAAVDAEYPKTVEFLPGNLVRFHQPDDLDQGWSTRIRQIDLDTRRVVDTGRLPRGHQVRRDPGRDLVLYARTFPSGSGLYHGDSGRALAEVAETRVPSRGRFLADGRIVLTVHDARTLTLLVLSPEGEELHRIERPEVTGVRLGGELSPGRVLVALREIEAAARLTGQRFHPDSLLPRWNTYVLDVDSGELRGLAAGVVPLGTPAEILAERLFLAGGRSVIRWNPETGEQRLILRPFERRGGDGSLPMTTYGD